MRSAVERRRRGAAQLLVVIVAVLITAPAALAGVPISLLTSSNSHADPVPRAGISAVFRHRGRIIGDRNSFVQMRLTRRGEDRFTIKGFKVKRAVGRCAGHNDRISLWVLGSLTDSPGTRFRHRIENSRGGDVLVLSGKILRGGRTVIGHVKTGRFDAGGEFCRVPSKQFRTRAIPQDF